MGWLLVRLVIERAVQWYRPNFYNELRKDYEAKYMIFFGVLLGLLAKPFTLASCGLAAWMTPPEDDIAGIHPPMNTYQEYCWNSRIVVYVSELPHYMRIPEMTMHHLLILMTMGMTARYRGPHKGIDISLAALWAEIPNSLRTILRKTRCLGDHPRLDWHLTCWATIIGFLTRTPGVILGMAMIPRSGLQGGPAIISGCAYFFYLVYICNLTYRRLKNSDVLQIEESGVFRLRFSDRFNINSTSLTTGLAVLGTQLATLAVYPWAKKDASPICASELINISWNILLAVTVAVLGSQLLAPHLQKILNWRRHCSVYLQAGLLIAVAVLIFTPTLQRSVDRSTLVGCVILCSTLSKAASQLASHLASVEKGLESHGSIICSICNLGQFAASVSCVISGRAVLDIACTTLLLQVVIRSAVDAHAPDTRKRGIWRISGVMMTLGILAAFKTMWPVRISAISALPQSGTNSNETSEARFGSLARIIISEPTQASTARLTLGTTVQDFLVLGFLYTCFYGLAWYPYCRRSDKCLASQSDRKGRKLLTPRNIGIVSLCIWAGWVACLSSLGQTPETHNRHRGPREILSAEPPFCTLVLTWQFWASISASVGISTLAAHIWQPRSLSQAKKRNSDSFWDQV